MGQEKVNSTKLCLTGGEQGLGLQQRDLSEGVRASVLVHGERCKLSREEVEDGTPTLTNKNKDPF